MKFPRVWLRTVLAATLLLGSRAGVPQHTQPGQVPSSTSAPDPFGQSEGKDKLDRSPFGNAEAKQAKLRDEERQKRLVSDSEKLLQLATQLHDEVSKTDRHILSVDVVKRADEIEKLAHNVKERMKG